MQALLDFTPNLLMGSLVTLSLALSSIILATLLGALGAAGKLSRRSAARSIAMIYTTIVRGVPELVLMLIMYYGGQELVNRMSDWFGWGLIDFNPFISGVLTIGFVYGAYLSETFRGAYLAIPRGQSEAAWALGLPRFTVFSKVIAPQLMRLALPGYGNVWLVLVKATAIVSVIGLEDMVRIADLGAKSNREPFTFFLAVIVVFLIITSVSNYAFKRLDTALNRGYA